MELTRLPSPTKLYKHNQKAWKKINWIFTIFFPQFYQLLEKNWSSLRCLLNFDPKELFVSVHSIRNFPFHRLLLLWILQIQANCQAKIDGQLPKVNPYLRKEKFHQALHRRCIYIFFQAYQSIFQSCEWKFHLENQEK